MAKARIDPQQIKDRVSLVMLADRCGLETVKMGAVRKCCCPFHAEKTPSCVLHEKAGGDWYHCFGCGASGDIFRFWMEIHHLQFPEAVEQLARLAGLSAGELPAPLPKRVIEEKPDAPAEAVSAEEALKWEKAAADMYTDAGELDRIAAWRGYRREVVEWAARRHLMGKLLFKGDWREAFAIQRPVEVREGVWGLETLGWHVRLAPGSRGNNDKNKASWRYEPRTGLGAWPFVVLPPGGAGDVRYWFFTEGQWDALAMVDLMGWEKEWPETVGLMGMRGASSWKRALEYPLRLDASAMLFADRDEAGRAWFVPTPTSPVSFSLGLEKRVWGVFGYWPSGVTGAKDLNDVVKALDERGRTILRTMLRGKIAARKTQAPKGPTFFMWIKKQANAGREDEVRPLLAWVLKLPAPRGRVKETVWLAFLKKWQAPADVAQAFTVAWKEWQELSQGA